MEKRLAIIGIFFDGYYDIWEDFLELWSTRWTNCPYPVYIVSEDHELDFDKKYDVHIIHAGKDAEYSKKVQTALEQINADYFLLVLEDFFFEHMIADDPLQPVLKTMADKDIRYLRMPTKEFVNDRYEEKYQLDSETGFYRIPETDEYTVTCQPSIWEKEFLRKCIGKGNYNAWVFEGIYCYSKYAHTQAFLDRCRIDFSNRLGLRHGAVQGKILPKVNKDFHNNGYTFKNKREVLSIKQYYTHRLKQIMKSSLPKPMQSMVKKVIKNESIIDKYRDQILFHMKENDLD